MKIYVTQGHQEGIGLEVFLKSCLFLSSNDLKLIELLAFKKAVLETLISMKVPFDLEQDHVRLGEHKIPVTWLNKSHFSQTLSALNVGIELSGQEGILYTLPTSKDQFKGFAGHTEYFRHLFKRPELGMFFSSPAIQMLLITDHIPVNKLSQVLTENLIYKTIENAFLVLNTWKWDFNHFLVSGINPHAGEHGLIGHEDKRIIAAIRRIQNKYPLTIKGPYPGDTIIYESKSPRDVIVSMYHDQGLALFKGRQGFIGSNITLGLPFPRFAPDHGTSFQLFGKNEADYRGCQFSLKQALSLLRRIDDGQNTSHKSKSS